ncbi:MAG: mandelate racemase/muconate lactonizing enzyme family protein [Chloroflexi bacterium]|nr:mandelate racemase/muconate lactonizing enzyme family protein [Chloroflexota bacterium]
MKIAKVEVLRTSEPIPLAHPYRAAWTEPSGPLVRAIEFSFYKVTTEEGLVGYGPHSGHRNPASLVGRDPTHVGAFWEEQMGGRRAGNAGHGAAGLEIAMWDLIGKAAGLPVYRLLGAVADRVKVYAATNRLLSAEETVAQVQEIVAEGFRAVKLRLHRPDPRDDLAVVRAVRQALGDDLGILVDANQNNASAGYDYWSRQTAGRVARALDELGVYYLEEPLPRADVEGLAQIAASVDTFIAGGEHTPTWWELREHLARGAYDIVQPDALLGGNHGISGLRRIAALADAYGRLIVPHVLSLAGSGMGLAATLQAMATVANCPLVEYPYDPPVHIPAEVQAILKEPLLPDADGTVRLPERPGIGVEPDEERLIVVG